MQNYQTLTTTLKQSGMRLTPQRVAVCKLLSESENHPTASQIYQEIKEQFPSLSLATIYNTLDTLVQIGAINVLGHAGDDHVHYDANTQPHVNLACVSCHKIADIESEFVQQMDGEISNASGYQLLGARVLYYGLCPDCQKEPQLNKKTW